MASYNKFQDFVEQLGKGVHQLHAAGHTLKIYLSDVTPDAATDAIKTDLAEFAGGTGYTSGGSDIGNDYTESGGTASLVTGSGAGPDIVWTAGAAWTNAFRYVVLYNDTSASDNLIAWWDYAQELNLGNGETFTVDFGSSVFTLA